MNSQMVWVVVIGNNDMNEVFAIYYINVNTTDTWKRLPKPLRFLPCPVHRFFGFSKVSNFPNSPSPYEPPQPQFGPGPGNPGGGNPVLSRLRGPAIALMICGPLGIIFLIVDLGFRIFNVINGVQPPAFGNQPANRDAQMVGIYGGMGYDVIAAILQIVVIIGALNMLKAKNYQLAMTAAIISVIPCCSSCCVVAIPFGIWALIVLMDPQVKSAFQ